VSKKSLQDQCPVTCTPQARLGLEAATEAPPLSISEGRQGVTGDETSGLLSQNVSYGAVTNGNRTGCEESAEATTDSPTDNNVQEPAVPFIPRCFAIFQVIIHSIVHFFVQYIIFGIIFHSCFVLLVGSFAGLCSAIYSGWYMFIGNILWTVSAVIMNGQIFTGGFWTSKLSFSTISSYIWVATYGGASVGFFGTILLCIVFGLLSIIFKKESLDEFKETCAEYLKKRTQIRKTMWFVLETGFPALASYEGMRSLGKVGRLDAASCMLRALSCPIFGVVFAKITTALFCKLKKPSDDKDAAQTQVQDDLDSLESGEAAEAVERRGVENPLISV